ncbi:MAG: lipocalin-like domain-containing protein [Gammaproteobacteria bacterium]
MSSNPFVGAWRLREACALTDDGTRTPSPLGERVQGQIMYDAAGNMSAQLMAVDRPRFSARTPDETPAAEFKAAFLSFTSYWGTYRIDEAARTVTHTVIGASAPSWPGSEQLRYYELNDRLLTLKTPPIRGRDGVKQVQMLVWEKIA